MVSLNSRMECGNNSIAEWHFQNATYAAGQNANAGTKSLDYIHLITSDTARGRTTFRHFSRVCAGYMLCLSLAVFESCDRTAFGEFGFGIMLRQLYTELLRLPKGETVIRAKAIRIGYKESDEKSLKFTTLDNYGRF